MRAQWLPRLCLGVGLWFGGCTGGSAQGLHAESVRVPMEAAGPEGLDALVVTPGGPGRHPLALVSHGSPRSAGDRPGMNPRAMLAQLSAFARRGFVAAAVMRRGYGTSPGGWAEGFGPCDHADYLAAGRRAPPISARRSPRSGSGPMSIPRGFSQSATRPEASPPWR